MSSSRNGCYPFPTGLVGVRAQLEKDLNGSDILNLDTVR